MFLLPNGLEFNNKSYWNSEQNGFLNEIQCWRFFKVSYSVEGFSEPMGLHVSEFYTCYQNKGCAILRYVSHVILRAEL